MKESNKNLVEQLSNTEKSKSKKSMIQSMLFENVSPEPAVNNYSSYDRSKEYYRQDPEDEAEDDFINCKDI